MTGRRAQRKPVPAGTPEQRIEQLTREMSPGLKRNVMAAAQHLALREMRLAEENQIPIVAVAMVFLVAVEIIRQEVIDRESAQ